MKGELSMQPKGKEEQLLHALSEKEGQLERELVRACAEAEDIVQRAERDGELLIEQARLDSSDRAHEREVQKAQRLRLRMDKRLEKVESSIARLETLTPGDMEEMADSLLGEIFPELSLD
jgi:hypothetical protein